MIDFANAIPLVRPGAKFRTRGDTLEGVEMLDGSKAPTMAELQPAWDAHVVKRGAADKANKDEAASLKQSITAFKAGKATAEQVQRAIGYLLSKQLP